MVPPGPFGITGSIVTKSTLDVLPPTTTENVPTTTTTAPEGDVDQIEKTPVTTNTKSPGTNPLDGLSPTNNKLTDVKTTTDGQTSETQDTQEVAPKDDGGLFSGVFGFLESIFENPIFHWALSSLAAIPGLGQVVSAAAAVFSLVNLVEQWVTTGKPPGPMALVSTLLYLGGSFIPGLGAFGGLFGMARTVDDKLTGRSDQPPVKDANDTQKQTLPTEPLADDVYVDATKVVRDGLSTLSSQLGSEPFWKELEKLLGEREFLRAKLKEPGATLTNAEEQRRVELEKLLRQDLPQAVFGETTRLAFGLDPADQTPTDHPVAGRFFALPEGATLESLGTIEGMPEAPAGLLDAIRAYSGLGPTEVPQAGRLLYLPTPEQVGSGPKPGEVGSMHMKAPEGVDARALLTKLLDVAGSDDTDLDAVAKQTLTNARLLLGVLNSMGPPPVKMPDNTSSTVGLNPLGEPIPVAP